MYNITQFIIATLYKNAFMILSIGMYKEAKTRLSIETQEIKILLNEY